MTPEPTLKPVAVAPCALCGHETDDPTGYCHACGQALLNATPDDFAEDPGLLVHMHTYRHLRHVRIELQELGTATSFGHRLHIETVLSPDQSRVVRIRLEAAPWSLSREFTEGGWDWFCASSLAVRRSFVRHLSFCLTQLHYEGGPHQWA